ncbi:MAG: hypothetical protein SFZ03_07255 [Candidatus Melainabacteria bacterium]|nr:hypothetical protein [Candidatus Melainabacteria bacterium]
MPGIWPDPNAFRFSPWNNRTTGAPHGGITMANWFGTMPATNQNNRWGWSGDDMFSGGLTYDVLEQSMRDQNRQYYGNTAWFINGGPLGGGPPPSGPLIGAVPPVNMRDVDPFGSMFDYRLCQTKVELMSCMATEAEIISTMQGLITA